MFVNRRNFLYLSNPYLANYAHTQVPVQHRSNAVATRAKVQAYKEAMMEAHLQQRSNELSPYMGGHRTPVMGYSGTQQDFSPCGLVPRPASAPHSYSVWESSGNSSSQSTESISSYRRRFGRSLCRIVTTCAAVLVILAVLGIIGIAVYLTHVSTEQEKTNYSDKFIGSLRILQGDSWVPDLLFNESPAFRAKATKYKNMFGDVFGNSPLSTAFEKAEVNQFTQLNPLVNSPGFDLTFQLFLDRRKIPQHYENEPSKIIFDILNHELTRPYPVAFGNLRVIPDSLSVEKMDPSSHWFEYRPSVREEIPQKAYKVVPLNNTGGGLLVIKSSKEETPSRTEHGLHREQLDKFLEDENSRRPDEHQYHLDKKEGNTSDTQPKILAETTMRVSRKPQIIQVSKESTDDQNTLSDTTGISKSGEITTVRNENSNNHKTISAVLIPEETGAEEPTKSTFIPEDELRASEKPKSFDIVKKETDKVLSAEVDMSDILFHRNNNFSIDKDWRPIISFINEPTTTESSKDVQISSSEKTLGVFKTPDHFIRVDTPSTFLTSSHTRPNEKNPLSLSHNPTIDEKAPSLPISNGNYFPTNVTSAIAPNLDQEKVTTSKDSVSKNELYDQLGISAPNNEEGEFVDEPTIEEVQNILENLLFLAASNSFNLLNKSLSHLNETKISTEQKSDFNNMIQDGSGFQMGELSTPIEAGNQNVSSNLRSNYNIYDTQDSNKNINERLPVDKFRQQGQRVQIKKHSNAHQGMPPHSSSMWDNERTNEFNVPNGGSFSPVSNYKTKSDVHTPLPEPVYVHNGESKNYFKLSDARPRPLNTDVIIPVISGNNVKYIRINRTTSKYPNVVVVNLSNYNESEMIEVNSTSEESRKLQLPREVIGEVLNRLLQEKPIKNNHFKESNQINQIYNEDIKHNLKHKIFGFDALGLNLLKNTTLIHELLSMKELREKFRPLFSKFDKFRKSFWKDLSVSHRESKKHSLFSNDVSGKDEFTDGEKQSEVINTMTLFVVKNKNNTGGKIISVSGRSPAIFSSTKRNSPIHVFAYNGNQSLDELLSEIFYSIQQDETKTESNLTTKNDNEMSKYVIQNENKQDSTGVPPGEDSLKVIELISGVLNDNNNYYFSSLLESNSNNNEEQLRTKEINLKENEIPTSTKSQKDMKVLKQDFPATSEEELSSTQNMTEINDNLNEITTTVSTTLSAKNHTYHKYQHQLFPVMTRPFNPIKSTTNLPISSSSSSSTEKTVLESEQLQENKTANSEVYSECKTYEIQCPSGKCIPAASRCNMISDCPDNFDELNCTCSDILKGQHYSRKICDGVIDCWDKSDEANCDWCDDGHFICTGFRSCVKPELVCDGIPDCPNGDDERDCVTIAPNVIGANTVDYYDEGYLMVRRKGIWGKLCVENFEQAVDKAGVPWTITDLGEAVCSTLTFDSFNRVERVYDLSPPIFRSLHQPYYEINITFDRHISAPVQPSRRYSRNIHSERTFPSLSLMRVSKPIPTNQSLSFQLNNITNKYTRFKRSSDRTELKLQFQETKCASRNVVKVKCKDLQCGIRPRASTQQARIVGGNNSSPGAWPWHAALYKEGEYQCGATLIKEQWLISAGHCFYNARNAYWVARLGALRRGTKFPSAFEQTRALSHIFVHPKYVNQGFINDISLLRLRDVVKVNDFVRPVCLPSPAAEVNDGQRCTLVGWGQLFEVQKVFPDTLQEVEVPLISTTECRKRTIFLPLYRITEDMFCAGYDRGGRDACLGDSGGPLMCQKSDGRWELMGVTSNGYGCARPNRPGVYTKVVNYLKWIDQVIELSGDERVIPVEAACDGHRCALGECVASSNVCDGKADCSDASDERNCL